MLHVNIQQVDGTEWVHTLWPVKFCPKAGANLFSLMSKLQGNKISSDPWNNIVVNSSKGDIILDHQIKTCNSWVDRVEFLLETVKEFKGVLWGQQVKVFTNYKNLIQEALGLILTVYVGGGYSLRNLVPK